MSKKISTLIVLITCVSVLTACTGADIHIDLTDDGDIEVTESASSERLGAEAVKSVVDEKNSEEARNTEDADGTETADEADEDITYELPEDDFAIMMNPKRDYLTVVNDDVPYEFGGYYDQLLQPDIVYVADAVYGEPTPIEKGALYAFTELQYALQQKGIRIGLVSAYRTEEDQQWVYDNYANLEGWSEDNTVREPGLSEHHTGLLLEIAVWWPDDHGNWVWTTETAERSKEFAESKILHETLADYGFVDRYPAGKEEITGVTAEPYEIRFVGSSKAAHKMVELDLSLEEYRAFMNMD